jgi:hypothetical protein
LPGFAGTLQAEVRPENTENQRAYQRMQMTAQHRMRLMRA